MPNKRGPLTGPSEIFMYMGVYEVCVETTYM